MGKKEYVLCPNAQCKPFGNDTKKRSWRMVSAGPGCCKFCDTPFPIDGHGGGNAGWKKRDGKGRVRPDTDAASGGSGVVSMSLA